MLQHNKMRLKAWESLDNKFDYEAFCNKCEELGARKMDAIEFSQKAGVLTMAASQYPDLPVEQAYVLFVYEMSGAASLVPSGVQQITAGENTVFVDKYGDGQSQTKCGSCGGGLVL